MDAYTLSGKMISLQEPAIKSGGEGAVYNIIGYSNVVAKIYLSKEDAKEREGKIREMSSISETLTFRKSQILDDIAWPLAPLFNKAKEFIGFGMQRITAKNELDDIYALDRKNNTGMTTYEKVTTLISLCGVVGKLHAYGQVFGDFNPNNIKIDNRGNVKFVDADSYHFNSGRKIYPCVVCAPGYVAPELIKKCKGTTYAAYKGTTFTKETDNFSLAVHCFRMLMNGCHPFTCKRHVKNVGSTPAPSIDKRVEKGETPFFKTVPNFTTPDWAPDVACLPPYIHKLFERAFVAGYADPSARPEASEWEQALKKYQSEMIDCKGSGSRHWYWKQLSSCPYCIADMRGKRNLMNSMALANKKRRNTGTISQKTFQMPNSNTYNANSAQTSNSNSARASNSGNARITNGNSFGASNANTFSMPGKASSSTCRNRMGAIGKAAQKIKTRMGGNPKALRNSILYWTVTLLLSLGTHILLGMYVYAPLYLKAGGAAWVEWAGAIGSAVSGIAGTVFYNVKWLPAWRAYSCIFRWYDYILSWLAGIGFAVGFGIAFFIAAFAIVASLYILAAVVILCMIGGVIAGIFSD